MSGNNVDSTWHHHRAGALGRTQPRPERAAATATG